MKEIDTFAEFTGKIARKCFEYGLGVIFETKPGLIKRFYISVFSEHYREEHVIDIVPLKYTLSRFKDTYTDDILKIVDAVWQKEKAYIQQRVDRMLDGKPFEFEDYEVCSATLSQENTNNIIDYMLNLIEEDG